MKGSGPKLERETIVSWNEADADADIWTASEVVHRRLLKRLGSDAMVEDGERHSRWRVPKGRVRLPTMATRALGAGLARRNATQVGVAEQKRGALKP